MVTFYRLGEPVKIVFDDRLPLYPHTKPPPAGGYWIPQLFNSKKSPDDAWWGVLLEKAYCKMNVNCARVSGGNAMQSFYDITGMPVLDYKTGKMSDEEIYAAIHEGSGYRPAWPMVASCVNSVNGLQSGHAYTIMSVYKLRGGTYNNVPIIKVMNPWGKEGYDGPWSDYSSLWTSDYKSQVGLVQKDDGIFFMPFNVFKQAFSEFSANMYNDNWKRDMFKLKPVVAQTVSFDVVSSAF